MPPRKTPTHDAGAPPRDDGVIRSLAGHPDQTFAEAGVREHHGHLYDAAQSGTLARFQVEHDARKAELERCEREGVRIAAAQTQTSKWVETASPQGGNSSDEAVSFKKFALPDKLLIGLFTTLALVLAITGSLGAYANLIGSGAPVFIEKPFIAALLAAMVGSATVALKGIGLVLETARARKRYRQTIFAATALVLFAWTGVFAARFHGLSPGSLDLDAALSPAGGWLDGAFVWLQLAAEILAGASLWLAADALAARYARRRLVLCREWEELEDARVANASAQRALVSEIADRAGRIVALNAARQAFIGEAAAEFWRLRACLADFNHNQSV